MYKRRSRRKTNSNFDISQATRYSLGFKKKACNVVDFMGHILHKTT